MKFEDEIILSANSEAELIQLINEKLKTRYLIKNASYEKEGKHCQLMIFPGNIDNEMTLSGGVKMLVGGVIYVSVLYYFL